MLFRDEGDRGLLAITQPTHAWLAGQMLREWGAPGFALPEPREAVLLGAHLHDLAWLDWELDPWFDPELGRRPSYRETRPHRHVPLWSRAVALAQAAHGDWPALLISRHGSRIYGFVDLASAPAEDAAAVRAYAAEQAPLQARLAAALGADAALVDSNAALVAVVDHLSLRLGEAQPGPVPGVPMADGTPCTIAVTRDGPAWRLDPWPFAVPSLSLSLPATRIARRYARAEDCLAALRDTPREAIEIALKPLNGG